MPLRIKLKPKFLAMAYKEVFGIVPSLIALPLSTLPMLQPHWPAYCYLNFYACSCLQPLYLSPHPECSAPFSTWLPLSSHPYFSSHDTSSVNLPWTPNISDSPGSYNCIICVIFFVAPSFCSFICFHIYCLLPALDRLSQREGTFRVLFNTNPQCPELRPTRRNSRSICRIREWMIECVVLILTPLFEERSGSIQS